MRNFLFQTSFKTIQHTFFIHIHQCLCYLRHMLSVYLCFPNNLNISCKTPRRIYLNPLICVRIRTFSLKSSTPYHTEKINFNYMYHIKHSNILISCVHPAFGGVSLIFYYGSVPEFLYFLCVTLTFSEGSRAMVLFKVPILVF